MTVVLIDTPSRLKGVMAPLHRLLPDVTLRQDLMLSSIITQAWDAAIPDCVILSPHTPIYERSLDAWLTELIGRGIRVILVSDPYDPPGDSLLQACWRMEMWDVVLSDHLDASQLAHRLQHPGTAAEWKAYTDALPPPAHAQALGERTYFQRRPQLRAVAPAATPSVATSPHAGEPISPMPSPRPTQPSGPYAARQLIALQGMAGGVGTSMVAVQCARRLSQAGTVLLWDWDSRGSISTWLGATPPDDHCWERAEVPDRFGQAPWAQRVWHFQPQWDVLTAQGLYPERAIIWSDAEMDAMLHWAERYYDYVIVDLGSQWSDPRHALVTGLADTALGITSPWLSSTMIALRWLDWVHTNGWRVAERHAWIGVGHRLATRDQHNWEQHVGERWMARIDWDQPHKGDPLATVMQTITQARWRQVPQA